MSYFKAEMSSLVEGDEQPDRPNSQTTVKLCRTSVAYFLI